VYAYHHLLEFVLPCQPDPARRPKCHQGIKRKKNECDGYKGDLQTSPSMKLIHRSFLADFEMYLRSIFAVFLIELAGYLKG
jgi:hypothetical protein